MKLERVSYHSSEEDCNNPDEAWFKRNPLLTLSCCDSGASDLEIYGLDYLSIAPYRATLPAVDSWYPLGFNHQS